MQSISYDIYFDTIISRRSSEVNKMYILDKNTKQQKHNVRKICRSKLETSSRTSYYLQVENFHVSTNY